MVGCVIVILMVDCIGTSLAFKRRQGSTQMRMLMTLDKIVMVKLLCYVSLMCSSAVLVKHRTPKDKSKHDAMKLALWH